MFGFPQVVLSDNGPQFRSDFGRFCAEIGAHHITSSPYFPQSNSQAESAVKNAKYLLIKCLETNKDFQFALSEFRRVPRGDKFSPAQLMFGFHQRGILPSLDRPTVNLHEAELARQNTKSSQKKLFDVGSHILPPLVAGTKVRVQHPISKRWDKKAVIVQMLESGKSYDIKYHDGRLTRRNRRFLRPITYAECAKGESAPDSSDITCPQRSILKKPIADASSSNSRRSPRLAMKKSVRYSA